MDNQLKVMEGSPRVVKKEKIIAFSNKVYLLDCHFFLSFSFPFKPTFRRILPSLLQDFKGSIKKEGRILRNLGLKRKEKESKK